MSDAKELRTCADLEVDTTSDDTIRATIWTVLCKLWYPYPESKTSDTPAQQIPEAPTDDFKVVTIQGGITNKLFLCHLTGRTSVIVRVYGVKSELVIDRDSEETIVNALSQHGFGTAIYGRFTGGILEGFLNGSCPSPQGMKATPLQTLVAQNLAKMHALDMPEAIPRSPSYFEVTEKWLKVAMTVEFKDEKKAKILASIDLPNIAKQFASLKARLQQITPVSPTVFAHNDLLSGNMLYDEKNNALRFVDFEYGSYNYRGFDLANHFCECCGFECEWENFPTAEEQKRFGRAYLTAADGKAPTDEQVEALYTEVQPYIAASHFFWGIWALVQAKFSVVDFDYLGYGHERLVGGLAAFRDHCEAFLPSVSADQ